MKTLTTIPEQLKTASRVLFNGQATGTGDVKGFLPSPGMGTCILALVTMGNAADLALTVKTADDVDGLNATALTRDVFVFKDDVRQTDAKTFTVDDASGIFTVAFCVPHSIVPEDKYLVLDFANSNAANILSAVAIEDTYYESGTV